MLEGKDTTGFYVALERRKLGFPVLRHLDMRMSGSLPIDLTHLITRTSPKLRSLYIHASIFAEPPGPDSTVWRLLKATDTTNVIGARFPTARIESLAR